MYLRTDAMELFLLKYIGIFNTHYIFISYIRPIRYFVIIIS
jgi:hypothetical protein